MKMFLNKFIKSSIFVTILVLFFSSSLTLARYVSGFYGIGEAKVAKWDNDIELLSEREVIIEDHVGQTIDVDFNVISKSDVSSEYSVTFAEVPTQIKLTLSSNDLVRSISVSNNMINVMFDDKTVEFNENNSDVTINGIHYTKSLDNNLTTMEFIDLNSLSYIVVKKNGASQSVKFGNLGIFTAGEHTKMHSCRFEIMDESLLLSSKDINLYATFEQID